MSQKKKTTTTANIPRVPVTDPTYPLRDNRRSMELGYGSPTRPTGRGAVSPLDVLQHERQQDLLSEYRKARGKKQELELKREIEVMRDEVGLDISGGGLKLGGMFNFGPGDLESLSKMEEGDKKAVLDTMQRVATINAATRGGRGQAGILQLLAATGGFGGGQQQGLGLKDVIEIQRMFHTIYEGAGKKDDTLTSTLLVKLLGETMPALQNTAVQNMQMAYQTQIAHLKANQSDPIRDIRFLKEMGSELGLRPGNVSNEVAMKTLEMQNLWKEKEWTLRMEHMAAEKQLGLLQQILNSPQILNVINAIKQGGGRSRRYVHSMQQPVEPPVVPPGEVPPQAGNESRPPMPGGGAGDRYTVMRYLCVDCGAEVFGIQGVPTVTCTNCGKVMRTA